jgi:hypothetical protein
MYVHPFFEEGSLEKLLLYEEFQVDILWINYTIVFEKTERKQPCY